MANPNPVKKFKKGEVANPKGRPKKGESLTELMRDFLEQSPEGQKVTYKELFIKKVYAKAMTENNDAAMKLIWNYLEGMPLQKQDVTSNGETVKVNVFVPQKHGPEDSQGDQEGQSDH
jgi:hypothetical protein